MLKIYSDGGSRGNPGNSAYAYVITRDGKTVDEGSEFLGRHTNNYAEYRGLIAALRKSIEMGADKAEFVMDSELVIKQVTGKYRVNSPELKKLHDEVIDLMALIPDVSFRNVRRSQELIPRADELVNLTLDGEERR